MAEPEPVPLTVLESGPKVDRLAAFREAWQPTVSKYAVEFGIGATQLLAAASGAACLVILLLSTLMSWEHYRVTVVKASNSITRSGLEVTEGKMVAVLTLVAVVLAAATLAVRRLFPIAVIGLGAVATCCVFLTLSFLHQLNAYQAESDRQMKAMYGNIGRMESGGRGPEEAEQAAKQVQATLNVGEQDVPGLGLYLAILMSLIASPALIYAGFFKPVPVKWLQKEGVAPFVQQHGALLIAQAVALLLGLGVYVSRY
jgi:hypothetical protein